MFTVMEGNRRITALKLLNEPDLAKRTSSPAIEKRYRDLSQMFKMNPIDELECVVFPDIQSAEHWIELKHTGENNGIGTVGWDGTAKARFRQRREKTDPALQVIDFMKSNAKLDNKTQIALDQGKVAVTNINRLLGDPFVRDFLGLEMNSGVISSKLELDETLKGFTKIIKDLANNRISVGDIYHKKDRKKYIQSFQKHEIPNSQKASSKKWALDSPPLKTDKKQSPSKNKRKKPLTTARKFLIRYDCILNISEPRINSIYRELQELEVEKFRNVAGVMLRVFIEFSLEHYIDEKSMTVNSDAKLNKKLDYVIKHLKANRQLGPEQIQQLKPVEVAISNKNSLVSIDTLHAMVHNRHYNPTAIDIKTAWDNFQPFIETLWE